MSQTKEIRKEQLEDFYTIQDELGSGNFAVVKRCVCKETNNEVAAKFIKLKKSGEGTPREVIEREANILHKLDHNRIIKLHEAFDLNTEVALVFELLSGGELFDKLCEEDFLTEEQACNYMQQVLEGINYLHSNNIMHLDIKPENIVLKSPDSTDIKLVDFGLAQIFSPDKDIKERMGTAEFVAPEIVEYETIGLYTDMWAIGVLAYILLCGDSPFLGDSNPETFKNICNVSHHLDEDFFDDISEDARLFVKRLLVKDTSKRLTAADCLIHPWIKPACIEFRFHMVRVIIKTTRLKAFVARRKWQESMKKMKVISAFGGFKSQ